MPQGRSSLQCAYAFRFARPIWSLYNDASVPRRATFGSREPPCLSKPHRCEIVGTFVLEVIHIHRTF